jgi:hypothetical protein
MIFMKIKYLEPTALLKHYGQVGQILDGLWFMEVEKEIGFEKAFKIDEQVWRIFAPKEAKRIKSLLGFEKPTFQDIEKALTLAIFDQSLSWTLEKVSEEPPIIRMNVDECKTLAGMRKVGRNREQSDRICYHVGMAFFETFVQALLPGTQVVCTHCPGREQPGMKGVCGWEFRLPVE